MRIGFAQFAPERGAGSKNIDRAAELIGDQHADLWVLPEMAASGYLFKDKAELQDWAENVPDGPSITRLRKLSRDLKSAVIAGFPERDKADIFNSAVFLSKTGEIMGVYRKIQLFDREIEAFSPGDRLPQVWDLDGVKIGVMICFDWIFPEVMRTLALKGADIVAHPSNLVLPHCPESMRTRCIENRVFAVTANRAGDESSGDLRYHYIGKSQIINPSGERLLSASENESVAKCIDLDPTIARDKYATPNNHIFLDRRPEFYRL
jgi:predicted amidohydrolase